MSPTWPRLPVTLSTTRPVSSALTGREKFVAGGGATGRQQPSRGPSATPRLAPLQRPGRLPAPSSLCTREANALTAPPPNTARDSILLPYDFRSTAPGSKNRILGFLRPKKAQHRFQSPTRTTPSSPPPRPASEEPPSPRSLDAISNHLDPIPPSRPRNRLCNRHRDRNLDPDTRGPHGADHGPWPPDARRSSAHHPRHAPAEVVVLMHSDHRP